MLIACCLSALASSCGRVDTDTSGGAEAGPDGAAGGDSVPGTGETAALDVSGRWTSSEFEDPFEAQLTQAADGTLSGTVCGPDVSLGDPETNCGAVTDGSVSGDTVRFSYRLPWPALSDGSTDYSFEGTASPEGSTERFEGQLRPSNNAGVPYHIAWTACPGTGRCP
ncbi:hypothetical protein BE17_37340 [Sorangium cellulosum]|uniref:Uncharacterized protein n=1 Tax=Sorangium cellulosum TaxID=56 RepID=A0A150RSJ1_SORCE|nr:hypothetical protein BE17_37340 [Sorangium cellulosum]